MSTEKKPEVPADLQKFPHPPQVIHTPVNSKSPQSSTRVGKGSDSAALLARTALNRARAAARDRGLRPGSPARRSPLSSELATFSTGSSPRDPQMISDVVARLLREKGWREDISVGGVVDRWRDIVGDEVADHCTPVVFDNKALTVQASSTAWATQIRILIPTILRRIAEEVGDGVVDSITVQGPKGPSFKRGPRSVQGPGPRDTWG